MTTIAAARFRGTLPAIGPKLLPTENAQLAWNAFLDTGNIQPYLLPLLDATLSKAGTIKTLYEIEEGVWCHWLEEVSIARVPIEGNTDNRVVFTGTDQPRVTDATLAQEGGGTNYPEVSYALGLPAPDLILDVARAATTPDGVQLNWDIQGTAKDAIGDRIARVYTYTFVNSFGEEGPPADPSRVAYTNDDECVELTNFAGAPTGPYLIDSVRIYRSIGTAGESTYLLVDEVPFPVVEPYTDCKSDAELGEALSSTLYTAPPADMQGVTAMANGMLAGFVDNTLYFSEPYQPHAWPEDYTRALDFSIVGIASAGNMLFALTKGYPYVIVGNHPEVLSVTKMERTQACVSARSIVDMGQGVIYASPDGLVALTGAGGALITEGVFNRRTWERLKPELLHGYYHKDQYFGFYGSDDVNTPEMEVPDPGGFIFDLQRKDVVWTDKHGTAAFADQEDGQLYYVAAGTNEVYEWDAGATPMTYRWKSRLHESRRGNFAAARVAAVSYPVTFKLYVDEVEVLNVSVLSERPFRLPTGFRSREWSVEVEGTVEVEGVFFAETMEELW